MTRARRSRSCTRRTWPGPPALPELFARAAAGYGGRFLWTHGLTDDRLVPLLEEGLAAVGAGDSALRVRLLSRLAAALRHGPTRARRERLMDEAIQMARRIGDPVTIASALTAAESALHAPHTAHERLANASEIVALATAAGDRERLFDGHEHAFWASWELGDPDRRARELAEMSRVAQDLRQPAQLWMLAAARATLALAQGRFAEAPELIQRAAEIGEPVLAWNAGAARTLQLFMLRREQGGLDDVPAPDPRPRARVPVAARAPIRARARLRAPGAGRRGRVARARDHAPRPVGLARRRAVVRQHLPARRDLRDRRRARAAQPPSTTSWRPTPTHNAVAVPELALDSTGRTLGILATSLERFEDAERHFVEAATMNERMGARPWVAHTQLEHARMLLRRGGDGDRTQATELLARAQATYRELGMQDDLVRLEGARPLAKGPHADVGVTRCSRKAPRCR